MSGLPSLGISGNADVGELARVRHHFIGSVVTADGTTGEFLYLSNSPKIAITGSLFFDGAHVAGVVELINPCSPPVPWTYILFTAFAG